MQPKQSIWKFSLLRNFISVLTTITKTQITKKMELNFEVRCRYQLYNLAQFHQILRRVKTQVSIELILKYMEKRLCCLAKCKFFRLLTIWHVLYIYSMYIYKLNIIRENFAGFPLRFHVRFCPNHKEIRSANILLMAFTCSPHLVENLHILFVFSEFSSIFPHNAHVRMLQRFILLAFLLTHHNFLRIHQRVHPISSMKNI